MATEVTINVEIMTKSKTFNFKIPFIKKFYLVTFAVFYGGVKK